MAAQIDPVLRDLLLIRSAPVVADRHGLTCRQVRERWKTYNTYGVERARRYTKRLAEAATDGALPEELAVVAEDIVVGDNVCLKQVFTDPAYRAVKQALTAGAHRP